MTMLKKHFVPVFVFQVFFLSSILPSFALLSFTSGPEKDGLLRKWKEFVVSDVPPDLQQIDVFKVFISEVLEEKSNYYFSFSLPHPLLESDILSLAIKENWSKLN